MSEPLDDEPADGHARLSDEDVTAVYDELRRRARAQRRKYDLPTLNATAMVHEAYIRLAESPRFSARSAAHLKYTLCKAMRHLLVDAARTKRATKNGHGWVAVPGIALDDLAAQRAVDLDQVLAVDRALQQLALSYPDLADVLELSYFGGFQQSDIAELRACSEKTVQRLLRTAKAAMSDLLRGRPRTT